MKKCKDCGKNLTQQNSVKNRLWCLTCRKKYMKTYNQLPYVAAKRKKRKCQDRKDIKIWLDNLKDGPCKDCQIKYPAIVMDWHHIGKKSKEAKYGITRLAFTYGKQAVLNEIKRCILLCSNCHRLRHLKLEDGV